jgi:GT2 family glycosyltransferase
VTSENLERLLSYIDKISDEKVIGWIFNPADADAIVVFQAAFDDEAPFDVRADLYRADVARKGYNDGKVGFRILVPERLRDGDQHKLTFSTVSGEPLHFSMAGVKAEAQAQYDLPRSAKRAAPPAAAVPRPPKRDVPPAAIERAKTLVHLDGLAGGVINGWAYDERNLSFPAMLEVFIDSKFAFGFSCEITRPDVLSSGHPTAKVGFHREIPKEFYDEKEHVLELVSPIGSQVCVIEAGGLMPPKRKFCLPAARWFGKVEGLQNGALRGWALEQNYVADKIRGGLTILISLNGQPIGQVVADQFRPDVADAHGSEPNCGFSFAPPPAFAAGRSLELRFFIIPGQIELQSSPLAVSFPDQAMIVQVRDALSNVDQLFRQVWHLRSQLKALMPVEAYGLGDYDAWSKKYFSALIKREISRVEPGAAQGEECLISVICPVYRPRIADFTAAVQSIIGQTYVKWELIIVDDASASPELEAVIRQFAKHDKRIKPHFLKKNAGISDATNAALSKAKGKYIALFDHDDLMVEVALATMLSAARHHGAKLVYCDEDKIDDSGIYSEVNLKPDWNYRLLLSQNYVCHILFVEHEHLRRVGALRTEYNGAQDHDLILRLAEITPPEQIHHVPEILYHWRKTPTSTAASGASKSYAVAAGIKAISDHLTRKGLAAEVSSPLGITCYDIHWQLKAEPKVSIIIPYREQIALTRSCVEAIKAVTEYKNYEIILIDNWSTSDEAFAFVDEVEKMENLRVLRIAETFNYSKLNNAAAKESSGEFLLFLNNDVLVKQGSWLTQLVGEALADPGIAAVGAKLLYPTGLVQHGGVILGGGGVADHAYRGLSADDPGYMARAICAQDLSAVTAACMLCKRPVFDEVGGFDEKDLQVAFNDVDLCLKIGAAGYRIVWTAAVIAYHYESLSRGNDFKPEHQVRFFHENAVMEERWGALIAADPHYHRLFSRRGSLFHDLGEPAAEKIN